MNNTARYEAGIRRRQRTAMLFLAGGLAIFFFFAWRNVKRQLDEIKGKE